MSTPTPQPPTPTARLRAGRPGPVLVTGGPRVGGLGAEPALAAVARGLRAGGLQRPDVLALAGVRPGATARELLDALGFDARMRRARAVVLAAQELDPRTLPASVEFEIATRARQAGVPAYAVAASSALGAFEARMLDLQAVLSACGARALADAGRQLAELISPGSPGTRT